MDLYYRLQHFVVSLPPLRKHTNARAQIDGILQSALHSSRLQLSPQAHEALLAYKWPGNWRQLVAVTQTLQALADPGRSIEIADLPDEIRDDWRLHQKQAYATVSNLTRLGSESKRAAIPPLPLRALTDSAIQGALASCSGNVSQAARLLGVHRSTLYRHLLQTEDIHRDSFGVQGAAENAAFRVSGGA